MSYKVQYINCALLLSVVLSSCASNPQLPTATSIPPTPTASPTPIQAIFYFDRSPLSYRIFETEATSLSIEVSSTVPGQFKDFTDISVEDGSGITTYKVETGESTIVHSLPAGKKRVIVTSGMHTRFRNKITGVFVNKVTFNGTAVRIEQAGKRILVYGDSLTVGGNVEHVSAESWPVLLRRHFPTQVEAYGYRALHDDASTAEARADFASKISSWAPDDIWLAIGVNDYAFGLWSARQFGEAYAATLDAIHSSAPQAILYAQSPIRRDSEGPNSLGDSLDDYRQQINAACLARSPWCIFVDGTASAFPQPDELAEDGIHLTTKSSVKYAEAVLEFIGK